MKIIEPYQITAEILNLIHRAEKYLVLVSPYVNFQGWEVMKKALVGAQNRGVNIFFYTRLEADNHKSWEEIENLGIIPKFVKNLHAKLYYNESSGIVTSMNLLVSSNLNAIEFGVLHNTKEDLLELKSFVKNFLEPYVEHEKPSDAEMYLTKEKFITVLKTELLKHFNRVHCSWDKAHYELIVNGVSFHFCIDKIKNVFWIKVRFSSIGCFGKLDYIHNFKEKIAKKELVDFETDQKGILIMYKNSFSTFFLDNLRVNEKQKLLNFIITFVLEVLDFKVYCRGLKFSMED